MMLSLRVDDTRELGITRERVRVERSEREANLRRRILGGEPSAWEELYEDCFDSLWIAVARKVGNHPSQIEDVVQETWLVAVRRIRRFDPERGSFRGWVHGIADLVAKNAGRRFLRDRKAERPLNDVGPRAAAPLVDRDAAELLEASFASLPARYRTVLRDKYVDELSVTEIATRRGATPKAIESLLSRARSAFREVYRVFAAPPDERGLR